MTRQNAVRLAVFLIALACLIVGALSGGFQDALAKAVNICAECIGLG